MSLAEVMTKRGLSYRQIASAAQIGVSTLHRIARGEWPSRDAGHASAPAQRVARPRRDRPTTAVPVPTATGHTPTRVGPSV